MFPEQHEPPESDFESFHSASRGSDKSLFRKLLAHLEGFAKRGSRLAPEAIAEALALSERWRDPELAYVWCHVHYRQEGYSTSFDPQPPLGGVYYGALDDFRNEAMVSDLVDELGLERIRKLDAIAGELLAEIERGKHNKSLNSTAAATPPPSDAAKRGAG